MSYKLFIGLALKSLPIEKKTINLHEEDFENHILQTNLIHNHPSHQLRNNYEKSFCYLTVTD